MSTIRSLMAMFLTALLAAACTSGSKNATTQSDSSPITPSQIEQTTSALTELHGETLSLRISRGVAQVAALWRESDGTAADFDAFCREHFVASPDDLSRLYHTLERNMEIISGYFHKMDVALKMPLHLDGEALTELDMIYGGYDVSSHLDEDLYANKIAFICALNFPFYSLQEKDEHGATWSRQEWAYARMGDQFISRVPASVRQEISRTMTDNDTYIAEYNIHMGNLRDSAGQQLFPTDMKLISHWGLRDELKSNYALGETGLQKQRMIYRVMKHIIEQTIPADVINNPTTLWEVYGESTTPREEDRRYHHFLENFHAFHALDAYSPHYTTQIQRAIDQEMEIPLDEVLTLFDGLLRSKEVRATAAFISQRLQRPLEPFDIWYDGFKDRTAIPEEKLTALTQSRYPNTQALKNDLPNILVKMGWTPDRAAEIASLIVVDASRGAGHAMGSAMRGDVARLRTRIVPGGMDYKGYNIAVHEFGHNVEQTISMNSVDHYLLNGVPNTGFTEALAFLFQHKDLELLGLSKPTAESMHYMALDNLWSCYEIMGVSIVDIRVWQWLYEHPDATPAQLRETVCRIAAEVWDTYYADVLGGSGEPLLAIYSHMLSYPLYLPNYAIGHLISFQIEKYLEGRNIATEVERMFSIGRVTPQHWMRQAVGAPISTEPTLTAAAEALAALAR